MNEEMIRFNVELETTVSSINSRLDALEKGIRDLRVTSTMLNDEFDEFKALGTVVQENFAKIEQAMKQIDTENTTINQETMECIVEMGHEMESAQDSSYEYAINCLVNEDYQERIQKEREAIEELIKQKMAAMQSRATWKWQDVSIPILFVCIVVLAFKIF